MANWEDSNRNAFLKLVEIELMFRVPRPSAEMALLAMWRAMVIRRSSLPMNDLYGPAKELVDVVIDKVDPPEWLKNAKTARPMGGLCVP